MKEWMCDQNMEMCARVPLLYSVFYDERAGPITGQDANKN